MLNLLSILLGLLSLVIVIPATIPLLGWANWLFTNNHRLFCANFNTLLNNRSLS